MSLRSPQRQGGDFHFGKAEKNEQAFLTQIIINIYFDRTVMACGLLIEYGEPEACLWPVVVTLNA